MNDDPSDIDISLVGMPPPRNIEIRPKVFINNITARLIPLQNKGIQKRKLIKIKAVTGNIQKPTHKIPIIKFLTGDKYLNNDSQINNTKNISVLPVDKQSSVKLYEISQPSTTINSSSNPMIPITDSSDGLQQKNENMIKPMGKTIVVCSRKTIDATPNNIKNAGTRIVTQQQSKSLHIPRVITTTPGSSLIYKTYIKPNNSSLTIKNTSSSMTNSTTTEDDGSLLDIVNKIDSLTHSDKDEKPDNTASDTTCCQENIDDKNGEKESISEPTLENDYEFALRLQRELDAEEKRKRLRRKSEPKPEIKGNDTLVTKSKLSKKESQSTKKEKKKDDIGEEKKEDVEETSTKKRGRKTKKENNTIGKEKNDDDKTKINISPSGDNTSPKEEPKKRGRKSKKGVNNLSVTTNKTGESSIEQSSSPPASVASTEKENNVDLSLEKYPRPPTMGFEKIIKNVYRCEPDIDYRLADEVCDCRPPDPSNIQENSGCGENCISRCMNLECHGCAFGRKGCSNRRMQRRQNAPVEAFWAGIKGWGLRAKADISKGDFIMEYCGEVLNGKQENRRARRYAKDNQKHHYFMHLTSLTTIDAYYKGNISRCMNHSCDPNAQTEKWRVKGITRVGFFATKNIKKGEEICFNYHFFNYGKEPQKCYCGSYNCKGTIGEAIPNDPSAVDDDYESSSCTDTDSPSEDDSDDVDEGVDVTPSESPPDENKNVEEEEEVSKNIAKVTHKSPVKKSKKVNVKESTPPMDKPSVLIKDVSKKSPEKDSKQLEKEEDMSDSTLSSDDEVDETPLVINKKEETPIEEVELTKEEIDKIESFKEKSKAFMEVVNKEADNRTVSSSTVTKCCDMLNDCFSVQQSMAIAPIIKKITETKMKETQLLENGILKILTDHLSLKKFVDGKGCSMVNMDMLNYTEMLLDSIINILLYDKVCKYAKYIAESQLEVVLLEVYGKLVQMGKDSTISHNQEIGRLIGEIKEKVAYAKNKAKGYINEDPDAVKSTAIIEDKINRQQRREARDYYRYSHRKQRYRDSLYYRRRREYEDRRRIYESRHRYGSRRGSYDKRLSPGYNSYKKRRRRESSEDSYYNDCKRSRGDYRDDSYRDDSYTRRSYNRSPSRSYGRSRHRSRSFERDYYNDSRKYSESRRRSRSYSSDRSRHRNSGKYSDSPVYDRRDYKRKRSSSPRCASNRYNDSRSRNRSRSPRRDSPPNKYRRDDEKRKDDKKVCDYKDSAKSSSRSDRYTHNDRKRSPTPIRSYDSVKKSKIDVKEKETSGAKVKEKRSSDEKIKDNKASDEKGRDKASSSSNYKEKDKKPSDEKVKDRTPSDHKEKDKKISEEKSKDRRVSDDKYKDKKPSDEKVKDRTPSDHKEKDKKTSEEKSKDRKVSDDKYRDRKSSDEEVKDRIPSDHKEKDKKTSEEKRSDWRVSDDKYKDKRSSGDKDKYRDGRSACDRKDSDVRYKDKKDSDNKYEDKKDADDKYKDKRDSDNKYKDKRDSDDRYKDRKDSDDKYKDKRSPDDRCKNRKDSDDKYKDKRSPDDRCKNRKDSDDRYKDRRDSDSKYKDKKDSDSKYKDKKDSDGKYKDKRDYDSKYKDKKDSDDKHKDRRTSDYKTSERKSYSDKQKDRRTSDDKYGDKKISSDSLKDSSSRKERHRGSSPYVPTLKKRVDEIMGFTKDVTDEVSDKKDEDSSRKNKEKLSLSDLQHKINLAHSKIKALNESKPIHVKQIDKNV
uniref:Histone-lysine N-methyltransferase n=1 Tax=Strongyloides papillosus TaxID=174720 RepID=A0A0N5BFV8_STREA